MIKFKLTITLLLVLNTLIAFSQTINLVENDQWKGYGFSDHTGKVVPDSLFVISKGVVHLAGPNPGYLMSDDVFSDFELTAEFRWVKEPGEPYAKKKKNSGLMYYVPVEQSDTLWPKGIQFQIKEKSTGDFILLQGVTMIVNDSVYGPGRSVVVKKLEGSELPVGEWNSIKIIADGDKCIQYLNGMLVNEGEQASEKKGRILLQFEGYPIDFRNIKLVSFSNKQ